MPENNYAEKYAAISSNAKKIETIVSDTNLSALKYSLRIIAALARMNGGVLRIPYEEIDTEEMFDLAFIDAEQEIIVESKIKGDAYYDA